MNQVEDIRKELANAWHVVTTAESRAAVAEARSSDLDAKIKSIGTQAITEVGKQEQSLLSTNEISEDLWKTKEELEKIKDEAHANREYMLQYKEMAHTNEIALKQMELAHEDYKSEAVKMKGVLENEVQSLKNQISELERKFMLKCEEAASATEAKENVLSSAMVETSRLRDEIEEKTKRVTELESHVSFLKDDLDKEHRRWRNAQDNYERQIILQSETIQELTSTSKELSVMQTEITRTRTLWDAQKAENDLLKSSWETEKSEMQQRKSEAERKCNEMDEQNRILHNRLEALHVRLSEKDQNSVGLLSVNSHGDGDLQNVISYLRRSKEIAETEMTLLKQEKLRLQTKVEGALRASESAQALLHSQLENSRELLLKDDEFKSLQLQVREINLLRESNVQLREENKHNFEECQKFRQEAQNVKVEADKLENCLKQKLAEFDALQKEADLLKMEICNLNNRNAEILESCKDANINEFEQTKDELEQVKASLSKKLELIMKLEQDLSSCHEELSEREKKLNDAQHAENIFKQELEKQRKMLLAWKNKYQIIVKLKDELSSKNQALTKEIEDLKTINQATMKEKEELKSRNQVLTKEKDDGSTKAQLSAKEKDEFMSKAQALAKEKDEFMSKAQALAKEKEEMNFKNQALLKQFEDLKSGRKVSVESEQAKKEQEKDTRIQMLEKTLERLRDDHRNEKITRKKSQTTMIELANRVSTDKQKVEEELQKHKSAVSIVLEKAGALASQLPSGSFLDEQTLTYFQSVSSFESAAVSFLGDTEGPPHGSPANATLDNSSTSTGQQVSTQLIKLPTRPSSKPTDEREKALSSGKTVVETRKPGRRFVRPSLEKTEDPATDTEIAGTETFSTAAEGKVSSSIENEPLVPPMGTRKRSASSEPEILEASSAHDEGNVVSAPPPSKKTKESEFFEASEAYVPPISSENLDAAPLQGVPTSEVSEMDMLQSMEDSIEEYLEVGKEDEGGVPVNEESDEQQKEYLDAANPYEVQYEGDAVIEELSDRVGAPIEEETIVSSIDQATKNEEIKEIQLPSTEVEENKEEGELMQDEPEQQPEDTVSEEGQLGSVPCDGSGSCDEAEEALDIASPDEQVDHDPPINASAATNVEDVGEDSDKRINGGIDRGTLGSPPSPAISAGALEEPQNTSVEMGESQALRSSTTISISEAARRNARNRQERMAAPAEPPARGRRPPLRRGDSESSDRGGRR
ncbi:Nuclear-pore anchor [Platanthera zijinensis]|uniref:Nuclear-pore anchor n=1 Tax=Platanthera zijinensis TaxID=2320716 RepID=A0AAP0AXH2_9ASPA